MRRFAALVDLAGERPGLFRGPEPVRSRDGAVHLVGDIRLDNRRELERCLRSAGVPLPDEPGDSELLLAAYLHWGVDCPRHLLGDFAFVIWDAPRRRLLGACDPLGVRQLCYARSGSLVHAAPEARQVLEISGMPAELDEVAAGDFLLDRSSEPHRTFFRGVLRLPPGHRLVVSPAGERVERTWDLDPEARTVHARDQDYADHFLELFRQSVRDRLRTPRAPENAAGILMSGGLDSTAVAAVAKSLADGPPRLFTASFVFDELRECDERPFIQAAATGLGLESCLIAAERFPSEACRPTLEGPGLAWDGCFDEALRQARSRGARVLLTGHGGDELLAGCALANGDRLRRGDVRVILEVARHLLARPQAWRWIAYSDLLQPLFPRISRRRAPGTALPDWIDAGFARRAGLSERQPPPAPVRARLAVLDYARRTPWDRACAWYDQRAAAYGIEVRHPFLDRRLVELLVSIPPGQLFRTGASKPLLRRAMAGLLPDAVRLRQGKTQLGGFLDRAAAGRIGRLAASPLVESLGFVDGERLRAACGRLQKNMPIDNDSYLWHTMALEAWLREHRITLGIDLPSMMSRSAA